MEYCVLSPETEKEIKEIRHRIHRLQNRGCIDSLQNLGVNTTHQVGASFVSLKTLASNYQPDEKIATLLWKSRNREEQIVACMLLPEKINKEKIIQLIPDCFNNEIAEYFGSLFLSEYHDLAMLAAEWSNSPVPFMQIAALTACARHLLVHKAEALITKDFFNSLISKTYTNDYVRLVAGRYR